MCDIGAMELTDYISTHAVGRSKADVAREIGISRRYLLEILSGEKMPGRNTIAKIEAATGGRVPAGVWFQRASTETAA